MNSGSRIKASYFLDGQGAEGSNLVIGWSPMIKGGYQEKIILTNDLDYESSTCLRQD